MMNLIKASIRKSEKNLSLLQNEKRLLEKPNEELWRRYDERWSVVGSSVRKQEKALLLILLRGRCV